MAEADRDYKIEVAEDEDDSTNYNHSYFSDDVKEAVECVKIIGQLKG